MKKTLFFLLLLLVGLPLSAQRRLSESTRDSKWVHVYRLDNTQLSDLIKKASKEKEWQYYPIDSKYLTDSITSYLQGYRKPDMPSGNYVSVMARQGGIYYNVWSEIPFEIIVLELEKEMQLIVQDKTSGVFIPDADIYLNKKKLKYDEHSYVYHTSNDKERSFLRVNYKGLDYYFNVRLDKEEDNDGSYKDFQYHKDKFVRGFNRSITSPVKEFFRDPKYKMKKWFKGSGESELLKFARKHAGYVVYDKPKYRPNDTVHVKIWVTDKNANPVKEKALLVRLNDGKIPLGIAQSYRNGGYTFSFVLSDSIDSRYNLRLDRPHYLSFEKVPASGKQELADENVTERRIYTHESFWYGDYELKDVNFKVRMEENFYMGEEVALFIRAYDENDMTIPDGRVQISLRSSGYNTILPSRAFLPDRLWSHEQVLDPEGETKIVIPDSIFPQANVNCEMSIVFLNSDNQRLTDNKDFYRKVDDFYLKKEVLGDSVLISAIKDGKELPGPAVVCVRKIDETQYVINSQLPVRLKVKPDDYLYVVRVGNDSSSIYVGDVLTAPYPKIRRTDDSLYVSIKNPVGLPYWYTVYVDDQPKIRDYTREPLFLAKKISTDKQITVRLQYLYDGEIKTVSESAGISKKRLNIQVNAPEYVSPGQTFEVEALVTDIKEKPQSDVDLTAFAPTSKFHAKAVSVPYFGKSVKNKPIEPSRYDVDEKAPSGNLYDWNRWYENLHLGEIEFYQFLNPKTVYVTSEETEGKTTIAPYVVCNGSIEPVHVVYINEKPVYFSKANHLNRYTFEVPEYPVRVRMRTAQHEVTVSGLQPIPGRHMIFSVNAGSLTLPDNFRVTRAPDTLSNNECEYLARNMVVIENNFKGNMAWLNDGSKLYYLNESGASRLLVGPIDLKNNVQFNLYNIFTSPLKDGGYKYSHLLAPGFQRQTSMAQGPYPFANNLSNSPDKNPYFRYNVLEMSELDRIYQRLLDNRAKSSSSFYSQGKGGNRLSFDLNTDTMGNWPFVKNVIIYEYKNPAKRDIYPGEYRYMNTSCMGDCRIVFLMPDMKYYAVEHVNILPSGTNYVRTEKVIPRSVYEDPLVKGWYDDLELANRKNLEDGYNERWPKSHPLRSAPYLDSEFTKGVSGKVYDENNKPLAGVIITVKDTDHGTITGFDGAYKLKVPTDGVLVYSCRGYKTRESEVEEHEVDVQMKPIERGDLALDEVVITGYAPVRKQMLTGSVQTISAKNLGDRVSELSVSEAQVWIRGTSTYGASEPLIIVDGLPYSGKIDDIDAASITGMNVLKDASATALYGSRGANGVILITTKKALQASVGGTGEVDLMSMPVSVRKNFKDVAFWQPMLKTDKEGKTRFSVTMPDDISAWDAQFVAMGKDQKSGYGKFKFRSIKTLAASLAVPRFAIQGDSINLIGKISNYTGKEESMLRKINVNGTDLEPLSLTVRNYSADTIPVHIQHPDTFKVTYAVVQATGYSDGEERQIPVYPLGTKETKGVFYALEGDTSIVYTPDKDGGEVVFRAEGSALPEMQKEIRHIREYEYLCNEQLASKLKALLYEKKITQYTNEPFDGEGDIQIILKKIKQNGLSGGGWGWWPNAQFQYWISSHMIEALIQAREAGYTVDVQGRTIIDNIMMNFDNLEVYNQLYALRILIALDAAPDYPVLIKQVEAKMEGVKPQMYDERYLNRCGLELIMLKQKLGIPVALGSVLKSMHKTMFGSCYWGEPSRNLFYNSIEETLLAYQILRADSTTQHKDILRGVRNYFFEQRKDGNWRNIYEGSRILETILPDMLKESPGGLQASQVKYSGGTKQEVITDFPVEIKSSPDHPLTIAKSGTLPVYVTAYQQIWNKEPERVEKEFIVDSYFEKKEGENKPFLKAGEPVKLKVNVRVTAKAEYVMIEVPIPAGCSYEKEAYQNIGGVETYREQFRNKTSIFCTRMNEGIYTFEVSLIARYTGNYHLNPAKAELMYFPVFYGREGMKNIEIR